MTSYINPIDNTTFSLEEKIWRAPTGAPLMMTPLSGIKKEQIIQNERSLWRYKSAFPFETNTPISLGEGCTPLIKSDYEGKKCRFKLEWFAPTGSFKDRGTTVLMSFLKQLGITEVIEDSSGNGGASVAAYGAAANMNVKILVPASTSPAKIAQIKASGSEIILVPGPREATEEAAIKLAETIFYASHNWHPMFLQGTKTLAYELWEDLGFKAPDNIIIPGSAGSNVLGCYIGFKELVASGQIEKMPRIFLSQPANCSPIHESYHANVDDHIATKFEPTIAEGTAIKRPIRIKQILEAIRETQGRTVAVEESEILAASLNLAKKGLYVEPTSAHAAAAFSTLCDLKLIDDSEETAIILTGSGLKSTGFYTRQFESA